jgi:hypothetical protein
MTLIRGSHMQTKRSLRREVERLRLQAEYYKGQCYAWQTETMMFRRMYMPNEAIAKIFMEKHGLPSPDPLPPTKLLGN